MKTFKLAVQRTVNLVADVWVEGSDEASALTRFQHMLESEECSQIEDEETWGAMLAKADPYSSEYDVVNIQEEED